MTAEATDAQVEALASSMSSAWSDLPDDVDDEFGAIAKRVAADLPSMGWLRVESLAEHERQVRHRIAADIEAIDRQYPPCSASEATQRAILIARGDS